MFRHELPAQIRATAAAANRSRLELNELAHSREQRPQMEFPPDFVERREARLKRLGIPVQFTMDLAHAMCRADASGEPTEFCADDTRHAIHLKSALSKFAASTLSRRLGRDVEIQEGGRKKYIFHPHREIQKGWVAMQPAA